MKILTVIIFILWAQNTLAERCTELDKIQNQAPSHLHFEISPADQAEVMAILGSYEIKDPFNKGPSIYEIMKQIDYDGLNLPRLDTLWRHAHEPILDDVEIKKRQKVFASLIDVKTQSPLPLMKDIERWFESLHPSWKMKRDGEQYDLSYRGKFPTHPFAYDAVSNLNAYSKRTIAPEIKKATDKLEELDAWLAKKEINPKDYERNKKIQAGNLNELLSFEHVPQQFVSDLVAVLDDTVRLGETLKHADSVRLRQMGWLTQALTDPTHPMGLAHIFEQLKSPIPLSKKFELAKDFVGHQQDFLQIALNIFNELAFYCVVSNYVLEMHSPVLNFPNVVGSAQGSKTQFHLKRGYGPRFLWNNIVRAKTGKDPIPLVPLSIGLGGEAPSFAVITGPNMQGKSTTMRISAHFGILAQLGAPVPAASLDMSPLRYKYYHDVTDRPADAVSLFRAQAEALWKVYLDAKEHPNTILYLDEIMPGTVPQLRAVIEMVFLRERLAKTGIISIIATHNWGMDPRQSVDALHRWGPTALGHSDPRFQNLHVDHYELKDGPQTDMKAMITGSLQALKEAGWDDEIIQIIDNELREAMRH